MTVDKTITERGKVYGDPYQSHQNIGLAWTGLIQQHYGIKLDHPLPASLVAQMMVQFKMQRSARVFHADNYIDAHAYTKFAEEFQQKELNPVDSGCRNWTCENCSWHGENMHFALADIEHFTSTKGACKKPKLVYAP